MTVEWYYTTDGRTMLGPFSTDQMRQRAGSGLLQPANMARPAGASTWAAAGTYPDLFPPQAVPLSPDGGAAPRGPENAPPAPAPLPAPSPLPAPPPGAGEPSFWEKLRKGTGRSLDEVRLTARTTGEEMARPVRLFRLRRRLRGLRAEQEGALVDLGVRLLSGPLGVPGGEAVAQRFGQLSQEQHRAELAGAGDRNRVKALKEELRSLAASFARLALVSITCLQK